MTAEAGQFLPLKDSALQSNSLDSFPVQLTDISISLIVEPSLNISAFVASAPAAKQEKYIITATK